MPLPLIPQTTVRYKTHLKRALVEAMREALAGHEDLRLRDAKTTIDFPQTEADYPSLVVRFFERNINNAGVGHKEWVQGVRPSQPTAWTQFKHYLYNGDVEFAIYALSSYDRDLLSDTLVQILGMGDIEGWTNEFFERIYGVPVPPEELYDANDNLTPEGYAPYHSINIDTDNIQGFGENQVAAPWQAEDVLVYQTSYRVKVFGEFYSLPPDQDYPMLEQVDLYPWIEGVDPQPEGREDPSPWLGGIEGDPPQQD